MLYVILQFIHFKYNVSQTFQCDYSTEKSTIAFLKEKGLIRIMEENSLVHGCLKRDKKTKMVLSRQDTFL